MANNIDSLKKKAKDLENILLGVSESGIETISGEGVLPKLRAIAPLDYETVKNVTDKKASDIVEAVILMYLPQEFIAEKDYVFQKMEVDKLTVSNLLFQMKTAEHAIKKLLEEIDNGDTQPRFFEVLASLQKSKMEIVKHLASFMVTMENNYKSLKSDWQSVVEKELTAIPQTEEQVQNNEAIETTSKFRGTKSLMSLVQSYVEEARNKASEPFQELNT